MYYMAKIVYDILCHVQKVFGREIKQIQKTSETNRFNTSHQTNVVPQASMHQETRMVQDFNHFLMVFLLQGLAAVFC